MSSYSALHYIVMPDMVKQSAELLLSESNIIDWKIFGISDRLLIVQIISKVMSKQQISEFCSSSEDSTMSEMKSLSSLGLRLHSCTICSLGIWNNC